MPLLILPPRITPDTNAMLDAAQAVGWDALRLDSWRIPPGLNERDVVLYGEPLFADVVAGALGVALLQAPFDWLPNLPERYRQREVTFTTLAAARQYSRRAFIKPADDKCFVAQVYTSGAELPNATALPDETPVLISEVVTWQVEYRCFVAERTVVTCSPYWRGGALAQAEDGTWPAAPGEREAALAFAHTLLADPDIAVPPAFVLDVGVIAGRGWAVVEANSAWGAGIYECDPALVLQVLRRAVVPRDTLTAADLPWARTLPEIEVEAPPAMPAPDAEGLVTLYRPVGAFELAKIAASGYRTFPPRLSEQPIFYPVLNERYAAEIARSWNTRDAASGQVGHVLRFCVRAEHLARYVVKVAGAAHHREHWIPAEELYAFNDAIVGPIEVIATYHSAEDGG
jgi:ATP-grasp domain, R2K clade family 2